MAVYSTPKEIGAAPEFSVNEQFEEYEKHVEAFVKSVVEWAKKNGSGALCGEEIRFGVGDGYARYIVLSLRPVKLIHLPVGDRWQFQYAHLLRAQDIREEVRKMKGAIKFSRQGASK
jgi:hypothetical protein